jgi:hypothetical protein
MNGNMSISYISDNPEKPLIHMFQDGFSTTDQYLSPQLFLAQICISWKNIAVFHICTPPGGHLV